MRRRLFLLGLLFTLTLSLHAQNLRDAVTVEVVDVPVFVSHNAKPVDGLTRDDFELYVNGQRQDIDYFDVVSPAAETTLRERRLFLLVFDAAFSRPHALVRAQKAAARLIESAPESDFFSVATFTSGEGVQFAVPFTSDRGALLRAIASLTTSKSGDPLAIVMTSAERASIESITNNAAVDRAETYLPSTRDVDRITGSFFREMATAQISRRAEHQVNVFEDLSRRMASLEGQKHVVLMTEGFEGYNDAAEFTSRRTPPPLGGAAPIAFAEPYFYRALRDMDRAFQESDVLLHTLDLEGLQISPTVENVLLAEGTGGATMTNSNDMALALSRLSNQFAHGYRLGFRPQNVRAGHNTIKVKLRNSRGLTVKHRLGFSGTPQPTTIDDGLYLADVILNDVPQTGTAAALELSDGVLHASVPMQPLAAQLGKAGHAELLVYAFDEQGKAIAFNKQKINVAADATGEATFDIPMPAGATVAKALLRVDDSLGFTKVSS